VETACLLAKMSVLHEDAFRRAQADVFSPMRKIFRAIHTGATKTCAGLVRNAGLFPSIRCPSHANANAAGISNSAMIQWNQTTMIEENPTGIAIMCSARLTGWLCAPS